MNGKVIVAAILGLAVTGCAAPLVRPNPIVFQTKVGHATDWQALAERAVQGYTATLQTDRPKVFVTPEPPDIPFATAYRKFLQEAFIRRGYIVVQTPEGAITVDYDVQTFIYGPNNQKHLVQYSTFWTTLAEIGVQLRDVSNVYTAAGIGLAAGPVIDTLRLLDGNTQAEALLTINVREAGELRYVNSETVYIQPSDLHFYWPDDLGPPTDNLKKKRWSP